MRPLLQNAISPGSSLLLTILMMFLLSHPAVSQNVSDSTEMRISKLEQQTTQIEQRTRELKGRQTGTAAGAVAFLFGAFCALWAQNTSRSAWLWFFLGLFFSVITVIVLLIKNSNDTRPPNPRLFSEGRKLGSP